MNLQHDWQLLCRQRQNQRLKYQSKRLHFFNLCKKKNRYLSEVGYPQCLSLSSVLKYSNNLDKKRNTWTADCSTMGLCNYSTLASTSNFSILKWRKHFTRMNDEALDSSSLWFRIQEVSHIAIRLAETCHKQRGTCWNVTGGTSVCHFFQVSIESERTMAP